MTASPLASVGKRAAPQVGLRRHPTVQGQEQLVGVLVEPLSLPAGSRLRLSRLRPPGDGDGPEFALVIAPPAPDWRPSRAERERLLADNCSGSATRRDPRSVGPAESAGPKEAPW